VKRILASVFCGACAVIVPVISRLVTGVDPNIYVTTFALCATACWFGARDGR